MHGRKVLLNFWQSWSAPCLTELRRLQKVYEAGRKEPPFIVAFHGGKDGKRLKEIRKQLGLSFALVQDSEQEIARKYGVRCWPTTVAVDTEGRVEHVQFGVARDTRSRHHRQGADCSLERGTMHTWFVPLLLMPLIDQGLKHLLRRRLGARSVPLGPFLSLRIVTTRVWLARGGEESGLGLMWMLWVPGGQRSCHPGRRDSFVRAVCRAVAGRLAQPCA